MTEQNNQNIFVTVKRDRNATSDWGKILVNRTITYDSSTEILEGLFHSFEPGDYLVGLELQLTCEDSDTVENFEVIKSNRAIYLVVHKESGDSFPSIKNPIKPGLRPHSIVSQFFEDLADGLYLFRLTWQLGILDAKLANQKEVTPEVSHQNELAA